MHMFLHNHSKHILGVLIALLCCIEPIWAAGPAAPSIFSNPLALILIILMILLLIVIGILGNIIIGAADVKLKKRKQETAAAAARMLLIALFIPAGSLIAQDAPAEITTSVKTIGNLSASVLYLMVGVLLLELTLIIAMLLHIRSLIKVEPENSTVISSADALQVQRTRVSWWDKFNKLRPVSQEADLDLGHEYDGIRELNNRLPPWWIYGFYLSIIFAAVYLWRFHVSHDGPSSIQEYETAVARADIRTKEYIRAKGEAVDENTVTLLTSPDDLLAGKAVYMKSCASCHQESGAGNVGPNLTDDYWLHGNDVNSIFRTIRYGINAMPQWQNSYSNKQIAQVTSYIKSLKGSNPPNPKAPEGVQVKEEKASPGTPDSLNMNSVTVVSGGERK